MMYQAVNLIFERQESDISAAEAHGIAVGMLSVEAGVDVDSWLQELLEDIQFILEEDKVMLINLFERTRELLTTEADDFAFDLFLPGDDEALVDQVEALRSWCQGFLFGVGYAKSSGNWPGESGEIMRDIVELTKIDNDVDGEDDANALMEIREYLRAAVYTVKDYFEGLNASNAVKKGDYSLRDADPMQRH